MVVVTFPDKETQRKAVGFLLGRFSGKVLKSGEHIGRPRGAGGAQPFVHRPWQGVL